MSYLLDTDICIYLLNGGNSKLEMKFREIASEKICISSVTQAELYYGALHSSYPQKNRERLHDFLAPLHIQSFDSMAALAFAQIKEALVKKGKPSGTMDILIAAIARAHKFCLVTNNIKHFEHIPQLSVENWS